MTETMESATPAPDVDTAKPTLSTKDKLKQAKYPTRTVDICLETDLQQEYEALHEQLREAVTREAMDRRLNSGGDSKRIAHEIEALQQRMAEYVITFRLQSLGSRGWDRLQKEHPPRDGNTEDTMLGYNPETFFDAAIRKSTIEPTDLDDEDWRILLGDNEDERKRLEAEGRDDEIEDGKLTAQQYNDLQNVAMALNVRKISVPNSSAASRILRPSEPE